MQSEDPLISAFACIAACRSRTMSKEGVDSFRQPARKDFTKYFDASYDSNFHLQTKWNLDVNLKQFTKMYFSCTSLSQHQIPNRRWTIGDSPEKDRVHLDIYVTGKDKYYHPRWGRWHASLETIYKEKVVMDTVIQFDDDGTNPLRDCLLYTSPSQRDS